MENSEDIPDAIYEESGFYQNTYKLEKCDFCFDYFDIFDVEFKIIDGFNQFICSLCYKKYYER